jgi:hypothetical protein
MGRKPKNQTPSGIQKRVSQKPYKGKLQKKPKMLPTIQDKLEEDLEETEEEEGIDLERRESALVPEDKNSKIESETISDQNQSQRPVYKYDESDMGPFKMLIRPAASDPKSNLIGVDIGMMLEKPSIYYCRLFLDSRRRWTVLFSSRNMANSLVDHIGTKENKLEAFIPAIVIVEKGIIRGTPLDVSTEELLERIRIKNSSLHVSGVKRLLMLQKNVPVGGTETEENNGSQAKEKACVDSKSVCLDFKLHSLPNEAVTWNAILKIPPFILAIKLCYKCGRHGHLSTRCNGKERCLTCGGDHPTGKGQKCSKEVRCINCGGGHISFSKDCGIRAEEEKINRLMATKNISAKEARKIVKTMDHRPPRSPHFRPTEDFPLLDGGRGILTLSRQISGRLLSKIQR